MSAESQLDLVGGDAVPVVGDQDAIDAATLDLDPNVATARVERVFDQLLDHRSGSFDHLARGDLGRQMRIENPDGAHTGAAECSRSRSSAAARRVTRSGTPARRATWTP